MCDGAYHGTEHGDGWALYRAKVTARQLLDTERLEQEAAQRHVDLRSLAERTKASVRAGLSKEMRALVFDTLIKDCSHKADQEKALVAFGFTS